MSERHPNKRKIKMAITRLVNEEIRLSWAGGTEFPAEEREVAEANIVRIKRRIDKLLDGEQP